jgi:hypothetical protein
MTADTAPNAPGRSPVNNETFRLRLPADLRHAVQSGARRRQMSESQWVRTAIMTSLMLEGVGTIVSFPDEMTPGQCVEPTP